MNAKFLLRKYLNTGIPIPEYQFNKLNTNLRTTYIRKRIIAIESGHESQSFEEPYISKDTWIKSLEKKPWNIEYIKNPTDEVQDYILKNHKAYIFYIKNPNDKIKPLLDSEEYQMRSLQYGPWDIQLIKNPTDEVQDYILKNHKEYIFQINNPNDKIKSLLDLEEYQMYAVEKIPRNIKYIKNPTPKVQMYVVVNIPRNIELIKNPTPQVQMAAVKELPFNIQYIENPTPQVQMYVVKELPFNIRHIKNPTPKVQMYVVKINSGYIKYIENPTDEVQDYILDNYPEYVKYIKNPNEKIKQYKLDNNINESRIKIIINESQLKTIIKDII
jgi:hypothetical protein